MAGAASAQGRYRGPIIDVHLHALPIDFAGPPPRRICAPYDPYPVWDPRQDYAETVEELEASCEHSFLSPLTADEVMRRTFAVMDAHNVIGIASGPLEQVERWYGERPDRIIPGLLYPDAKGGPSPEAIRRLFEEGRIAVLGEVVTQYLGIGPDSPSFEPYLAMAEEVDLPVGIHIGPGPPGSPYLHAPRYRARMHSPLSLEEPLLAHPRLRLYVMHAGYPMIDDLIAVLHTHPQVYVGLGVISYVLPRAEFHRYLRRIVQAGFSTRILFGSDQMIWPETIEYAIESIESADFLTDRQKADIFYDNAARFLRLSDDEISRHRGLGRGVRSVVPSAASAGPTAGHVAANHRALFPKAEGPFPTVVAIPGCSGVSLAGPETDEGRPGDEADRLFRRHYARMAERLRDGGFGVVLVDYLTSEGVANTCAGEISHERVGEYVAAALEFARSLPQVDPSSLYVVGWSHGGAGVVAWLQSLEQRTSPGVAGAVAVYPSCGSRDVWRSETPVLVVLGEADDITPPEECDRILGRLPESARVEVRRYDDARHGFDFTEGPSLLSIGGGMTVGRNPAAGEEAWAEIFAFLRGS
ncbi:MAG: amidohydrolase family protein [Thermoanaerobaculia bacterium]|nr:amidohydrolase family protein [Thermoanaerobaculia bacterium]